MIAHQSVADILCEHVRLSVECIDRMYLNVYVPGLQYAAGLVAFVHRQLELPIASTAPLGNISDGFSAAMHRFARDQHVPWVDFVKGQRKDDVMHANLATFTGYSGLDPEVSNFGNQPLGRFQDVTPYPPSRLFFFSIISSF